MCFSISLFRSLAIPLDRLRLILGDTKTMSERKAEYVLSIAVPLFGRFASPYQTLCIILLYAPSVNVHPRQISLSISVALIGQTLEFLKLGRITLLCSFKYLFDGIAKCCLGSKITLQFAQPCLCQARIAPGRPVLEVALVAVLATRLASGFPCVLFLAVGFGGGFVL